ncbi:histidine phosphatase superfamily domain-containing protein [Rhizoctonia solani AG-1 IA]|uniref:Histidine phosphatase superfamily domain-containing protein n=1 Tax=Thanatephorus cucumeris (strain AG1-IA) TaxID=983506 RepID=L8WU71_THACA|nr:histidine phosphatase superfamily domain-containing protein [Rhizoctonia solani AG-1 IA]
MGNVVIAHDIARRLKGRRGVTSASWKSFRDFFRSRTTWYDCLTSPSSIEAGQCMQDDGCARHGAYRINHDHSDFPRGETEWSLNGRHTGRTDIPLTDRGVSQISSRAGKAIGPELIDPAHIEYAFISPRQRASKTFELLFASTPDGPPAHELIEECREWDYGEYEGLKPAEIQEVKCPSGESPEEITARIDGVIEKVRTIHKKYFEEGIGKRDVVIVAHGPFSARSWPWFWTKDSD